MRAADADPSLDLLWCAIDEARARCEAEPERLAERLDDILRRMSSVERARVLEQLAEQLDRADHWDLLAAVGTERGPLSARAFLELRLWLVAQGRAAFEQALREPTRLVELVAAGDIRGGYYRDLGTLLRHHRALARVLDGDEGNEPAAPSRGEPPEPSQRAMPIGLGEMLRGVLRGLFTRGDAFAWLLRLALLILLVGSVVLIRSFGWWSLLLVPALLVLVFVAVARGARTLTALGQLRRARAKGSAKLLHGQQRYELHFQDPAPSDETLARTRARVEVALAWIGEQADAYGQRVSFECTAVEHGISDRPPTLGAASKLERAHVVELHRGVRRRISRRADGHPPAFVLVFTTSDDHRACAWVREATIGDSLELCVLPVDAWPGAIAHEILHLFGAPDLYFEDPTPYDKSWGEILALDELFDYAYSRIASWTITRSIMRMSLHPHAVIDPLTAYTVGWRWWPRGRLPGRLRTPWADE